jgi:hypothetical protein
MALHNPRVDVEEAVKRLAKTAIAEMAATTRSPNGLVLNCFSGEAPPSEVKSSAT